VLGREQAEERWTIAAKRCGHSAHCTNLPTGPSQPGPSLHPSVHRHCRYDGVVKESRHGLEELVKNTMDFTREYASPGRFSSLKFLRMSPSNPQPHHDAHG
jgi:hypothetical protein